MPEIASLFRYPCAATGHTVGRPAAAQLVYGLSSGGLISFSTTDVTKILSRTPITGVAAGQQQAGLDFRPATGELFMLGYNYTTQTGQLYTLNLATAVATPRGSGPLTLALGVPTTAGTDAVYGIGFDFDQVADRIRVTSPYTRANLSFDPVTGNFTTDTPLAYAVADANASATPALSTLAYSNITGTSAYALDVLNKHLVSLQPAALGTLHTISNVSLTTSSSIGNTFDLDIYSPSTTSTDVAYLLRYGIDPAGCFSFLLSINLTTGTISSALNGAEIGGVATACVNNIAVHPASLLATRPTELATNLVLAPNPVASGTQLSFDLSRTTHVELTVTDALGRTMSQLDAGQLATGPQRITWARQNQAVGVYFFSLRFDGQPAGTRRGVLTQ